jgi:hypothetical protein
LCAGANLLNRIIMKWRDVQQCSFHGLLKAKHLADHSNFVTSALLQKHEDSVQDAGKSVESGRVKRGKLGESSNIGGMGGRRNMQATTQRAKLLVLPRR